MEATDQRTDPDREEPPTMTTATDRTAPMTAADARAYLVREGSRYTDPQFAGDDGYGSIESAIDHGWRARSSWGLNGWDLGAWPIVVYFFRDRPAAFELAEYIEGDVKVWTFPTDDLRSALVDTLAYWWWDHEGESWTAGHSIDAIPDRLRGPFSWGRLNVDHHRAGEHRECQAGCPDCDLIARAGVPAQ